MSHWNYRIVKVDGELKIYDVNYNDDGVPTSRSVLPSHFYGDTIESIREQLEWFQAAIEKPVLSDSEIGTTNHEQSSLESRHDA